MKPSEILDAAANIVLRDGWHQGAYFSVEPDDPADIDADKNRTAPCCQAGAICRAAFGVAWMSVHTDTPTPGVTAYLTATSYMDRYVRRVHRQSSSIYWNDLPTTTKDDIVNALRGAADDAREAGE
ncbi:hypothetical protein ACFY7C_19410 [Streptomyces sp. NPDC012769]|uniref:DUF6197 family protein n=1 Tax=Streptomyces sp. NPDC012769 TaxID=3364848 RepID=UPI0036BC843C